MRSFGSPVVLQEWQAAGSEVWILFQIRPYRRFRSGIRAPRGSSEGNWGEHGHTPPGAAQKIRRSLKIRFPWECSGKRRRAGNRAVCYPSVTPEHLLDFGRSAKLLILLVELTGIEPVTLSGRESLQTI
jgi:hypothetical protein